MKVDLAHAKWFTSSRSGSGKDCVEVAHLDDGLVAVRDSKNPTGPTLLFSPTQWDTFLDVTAEPTSEQTATNN